jgi:hypothetical protein
MESTPATAALLTATLAIAWAATFKRERCLFHNRPQDRFIQYGCVVLAQTRIDYNLKIRACGRSLRHGFARLIGSSDGLVFAGHYGGADTGIHDAELPS